MHQHWGSNRSSSINELTQHSDSLCTLDAWMIRAAHGDDEKTYARSRPWCSQDATNTLHIMSNYHHRTPIHTLVIILKLSLCSTMQTPHHRHSQLLKNPWYLAPDHILPHLLAIKPRYIVVSVCWKPDVFARYDEIRWRECLVRGRTAVIVGQAAVYFRRTTVVAQRVAAQDVPASVDLLNVSGTHWPRGTNDRTAIPELEPASLRGIQRQCLPHRRESRKQRPWDVPCYSKEFSCL